MTTQQRDDAAAQPYDITECNCGMNAPVQPECVQLLSDFENEVEAFVGL